MRKLLEIVKDLGACHATVHGVAESDMILRQYSNKINTAPSTYELPSYVWLCKAMLLNL